MIVPSLVPGVWADGTISQADRRIVAWLYGAVSGFEIETGRPTDGFSVETGRPSDGFAAETGRPSDGFTIETSRPDGN